MGASNHDIQVLQILGVLISILLVVGNGKALTMLQSMVSSYTCALLLLNTIWH